MTAAVLAAMAGVAMGQVQHGTLDVTELDAGNFSNSVTVTRVGGAGPWVTVAGDNIRTVNGIADETPGRDPLTDPADTVVNGLDDDSSRGDYVVDFGTGDDQNNGVLMVGPLNDDRIEPLSFGGLPYFATVSTERATAVSAGGLGRYFISVHASPSGSEANYDVALGFFPFADGWLAGNAYNSVDGGVITSLVATPGFVLSNLFAPAPRSVNFLEDQGTGLFTLNLAGLDVRRDGVLLVTGAENEDNYAGFDVNILGQAVIRSHDNGVNGGTFEQDPVGFVFIPEGTAGVVMATVTGSGTTLFSQGEFTVGLEGAPGIDGTYRITIPGQNPGTGTLLVSPAILPGGNTVDNPVFVIPQSDSWLVTTRDLVGMGLQDIGSVDISFNFAFLPNSATNIRPGTPSRSYVERLGNVVAAKMSVTEITSGNTAGDVVRAGVTGSDALDLVGLNRGDFGISWLDARLDAFTDNSLDGGTGSDGLPFISSAEFIRDNSVTGSAAGWGTASWDNGEARMHVLGAGNTELNSNFAVAFFPAAAGFLMAGDVQDAPNGFATVDVGPASAETDGVLIATNWDNSNRFATVNAVGSTFQIQGYSGAGVALTTADAFDYGYVYLPYSTSNLVAGRLDAAGNILSSTTEGGEPNFTVTLGTDGALGFPVFEVTIPGVDSRAADAGIILVNAATPGFAASWEAGENGEFEIAAIDAFSLVAGTTALSFAYIPAEGLGQVTVNPCPADLTGDGLVNIFDIFAFFNAFGGGDLGLADFTNDGALNIFDIFAFFAEFGAGCP